MTGSLAIRARQVVKKFGNLTAVDHVDLDVPTQSIFGFLGPNGSGKSTTIRVLLGLLTPTSGEIEVLGKSVPQQSEAVRAETGYMTQTFSLYRDLSTIENLNFVGRIHGLGGKRLRQRVGDLIDRYQLSEFADRQAGATSGGQRQRLALAAAVLTRPRLLVLDEPTSAVDPQNRREFWDRLFDLVEQGTTILVSTHYMDEAERCHRLAILKQGRVAALGDPPAMMAALDGQVFAVDGGDLSAIRQRLGAQPGVIGVGQLGAQLRVLVAPDMADSEELEPLIGRIDPGAVLRPAKPSLEDVFVHATSDYSYESRRAA